MADQHNAAAERSASIERGGAGPMPVGPPITCVGPEFGPVQGIGVARLRQQAARALGLVEEAQARLCADPEHDIALAATLEQARRVLAGGERQDGQA